MEERILDLLRERPGLRVGEIAKALRMERSQVNAVLSGALQGKVARVDRYRWSLADESSAVRGERRLSSEEDTPLAQLCRYYLDCLAARDFDDVSTYASGRFGDDYVELKNHPLLSPRGLDSLFEQPGVRDLLERMRQKEGGWDLFLGYPVLVHHVRSERGWEGNIVIPLFLHPLEGSSGSSFDDYGVSVETPQLNLRAFKLLLGASGRYFLEELGFLQEELGIDDSSEYIPEIDELASLLREIKPSWPWRERTDAAKLNKAPKLGEDQKRGIYNRAVLIMNEEEDSYTRGLELELYALQRASKSEYAGTALGTWLHGEDVASSPDETSPLIEIFPLNSEQRQTVEQGLRNKLTVVTGPPGTGKSQVVSSMIINAAWKSKQTLFASRNNKAVDVVETRVNSLGPRPVLIRTGFGYDEKLASHLTRLLSVTAGESERTAYQATLDAHEAIGDRFERLTARERDIVELRNQVDALEQVAESARHAAGEASFHEWAAWRLDEFEEQLDSLKAALRAADYARQGPISKLFWVWVKEGRRKKLEATARRCRQLFNTAQVPEPADGAEGVETLAEPIAKLETSLSLARSAKDYFDALAALKGAGSLEEVSVERSRLTDELKKNSSALWEHWLNLTPDRLTSDDRRALGEYLTSLKWDARGRSRTSLSEIGNVLPCWAVTSLSARGRIPFKPGFFDLLVVDEASQCDIASVLPLLYRAKRVMVIGDPQQLTHIPQIGRQENEQFLDRNDVSQLWSHYNSLYDLATYICRGDDIVELKDHHRSHSQIIDFSNQRFYQGHLRVATRYENLRRPDDGPAIRWIQARGRAHRPSGGSVLNEEECQAVVTELHRLTIEQGYVGTIGVVSPFRAQVELMKSMVEQDKALSSELKERDFLVDTAHGFQGDERDLIIFSPVVSPGMQDSAKRFLGKNYNLFNVAVTRARAALIVVGDQIAVANSGIDHLDKLPDYIKSLSKTPRRKPTRADLGPTYPPVDNPDQVSEWERRFYEGLYAAGLRPRVQYPVEQYLLDFALLGPGRKLDIEVDGERYHKNWDGELLRRDQIRNQRLIELGWDVMRFWVYQIRDDFDACVRKVKAWADATKG